MFTRPNKLVVVVEIERSFQSYVKLVFVLSYSLVYYFIGWPTKKQVVIM